MSKTCQMPVYYDDGARADRDACGELAVYSFVLDSTIKTMRCAKHMAENILEIALLDGELCTIQKEK